MEDSRMEASTVMKASNTLVAGREVASSEVAEDTQDGETTGSGCQLTPEVTEEDPAEDTDSKQAASRRLSKIIFFKFFCSLKRFNSCLLTTCPFNANIQT
jgi:hypothetical protein